MVASTEAASTRDAESDRESQSGGFGGRETASDNSARLKVSATSALAGISYDFGLSTIMKVCLTSLENTGRYFSKGYGRPPGVESVPDPRMNEAVVFEDFFTAMLRMPPHLVLVDILHKFWVQLHQLMPNAIVQIGKFIWVVTSCGGWPTADVFSRHFELHHQNKKIHLEGSETTLAAQFGCISFHPSQFRNQARLTPAMQNKWMSDWDGSWFYCRVPVEQPDHTWGKGNYPLSSTMTRLDHLVEAPSKCDPKDTNFVAFVEATCNTLIFRKM
jgi:hypothetical protein